MNEDRSMSDGRSMEKETGTDRSRMDTDRSASDEDMPM